MRELSEKELPGGELSAWGYCPGRTCPGGTVRREFTGHRVWITVFLSTGMA